MNILITGGGGFLGFRLARTLLKRGQLGGKAVSSITLLDGAFPPGAKDLEKTKAVTGDVSDAATIASVCTPDIDAVFHLAAVVSGAAEADFDLGMRVNLKGMELLLAQMRKCKRPPRLVYTSSVAAFGGELPAVLDDSTIANPQTSYGAQKVIGEYLVADLTRKGMIDGRSLRLPTIVVRPGKPNLAASSFASGIIREPLNGAVSECPVPDTTGVWILSPKRVVEAFIHAHDLPSDAWPSSRVVNLPGITLTLRDMIEAMGRVAGKKAVERVKFVPDLRIQGIVKTWPVRFRTERAAAMGFKADSDFDSVVRDYLATEGITVPA